MGWERLSASEWYVASSIGDRKSGYLVGNAAGGPPIGCLAGGSAVAGVRSRATNTADCFLASRSAGLELTSY